MATLSWRAYLLNKTHENCFWFAFWSSQQMDLSPCWWHFWPFLVSNEKIASLDFLRWRNVTLTKKMTQFVTGWSGNVAWKWMRFVTIFVLRDGCPEQEEMSPGWDGGSPGDGEGEGSLMLPPKAHSASTTPMITTLWSDSLDHLVIIFSCHCQPASVHKVMVHSLSSCLSCSCLLATTGG